MEIYKMKAGRDFQKDLINYLRAADAATSYLMLLLKMETHGYSISL
jgi:hypothetical protein